MLETVNVPDDNKQLGDFGFAGDDHVIPFEVGPLDARGREPLASQVMNRRVASATPVQTRTTPPAEASPAIVWPISP